MNEKVPKNQEQEDPLIFYKNRIKDLEEISKSKGEFLAKMSHELRSPMTCIMGMGQFLLDSKLDPEQKECAEMVLQSAKSLLTLINDILDYSKLEAQKSTLENITFDLHSLLQQTFQSFSLQMKEKALEMVFKYPDQLQKKFNGDPGKLRQLITNLISNAIKFTKQGHIALEVELLEKKKKICHLKISVEDTGIGIPEKAKDKIFESFEQVDSATTRKYGGTGLGLAICKQISTLMNGNLTFTSDKSGTKFYLNFPLDISEEKITTLKQADVNNVRVLCVDDNAFILKMYAGILTEAGMKCSTCQTGREAIECLKEAHQNKQPFQVVVTDYIMPEMDGAELGTKIKQDPDLSHIHLVMQTAIGRRGHASMMLNIGFEAYLSSPFSGELLLSAIACALADNQKGELITKYTIQEKLNPKDTNLDTQQPKKETKKQKANILVAEDDVHIQKVISKLLKKLGHTFTIVPDGRQAVDKAFDEKFDLILMDYHMPILDGLKATKEIREKEGGRMHTWIIASTASGMQNVDETCLKGGMDDYIAKPFDVDTFIRVIEKGIEMSKLNQLQGS